MKKKRSDSSSGPYCLKIFIFPYEPSGEVWESQGGGASVVEIRSVSQRTGLLKATGQECALLRPQFHKLKHPDSTWSVTSQIRDLSQMCHQLDKVSSFVIRAHRAAVLLLHYNSDITSWCLFNARVINCSFTSDPVVSVTVSTAARISLFCKVLFKR